MLNSAAALQNPFVHNRAMFAEFTDTGMIWSTPRKMGAALP